MHGKASLLVDDGEGPFAGIEGPVAVGRYHPLCTRNLPKRLRVHAEIDGMAMAISDRRALQAGLQFHPESILTPAGDRILANLVTPPAAAPGRGGGAGG
ncbi:MAG: anthranilate synthase component [Sphingomonadales bacterium]|nr:anthranilate synthase component [Sphingomonadales bacterium]